MSKPTDIAYTHDQSRVEKVSYIVCIAS